MKKIVFCLATALCLASCSTIRKTAKTMVVSTDLTSTNQVDLVVSPTKAILEDYVPTKGEKKGGMDNVKQCAISKLLKQNGNADVLVEPQFEYVIRKGDIKRITVTGYPATYKNFKSVNK